MGMPAVPFTVLAGVALVWTVSIVAWRLVVRRLGLGGPAPDLGERERIVRRNLRLLLAVDFLLMYPVGVPAAIALALVAEDRRGIVYALTLFFSLALFSVPLPSLARSARRLAQQRLAGTKEEVEPSLWVDGGQAVVQAIRHKRNPYVWHAVTLLTVAAGCWLGSCGRDDGELRMVATGLFVMGAVLFELGQRGRR